MAFRKVIILFVFTCISASAFSQKEGNIWVIEDSSGLDFNYSPPKPIDSTMLLIYRKYGNWPHTYTPYHCLSDSNGAILTYVGFDVSFNRKHKEMPNSWAGSLASTNTSAAVCKWPYNDTLVYIFRTQNTFAYDLQYSLVNLKLDSGRGDVMKGYKYAELSWDKFRPGFAFFQQPNKKDMWMVVKRVDTKQYYSFKIGSGGVDSANPVISTTSLNSVSNPGSPYSALSEMKVSPDGRTFLQHCYDVNQPSLIELVHFSDTTGKVSDPILLTAIGSLPEFSKSGRFLYVSTGYSIIQYDLSVWDSTSIISSAKFVAYEPYGFSGLQLGPDCRIYVNYVKPSGNKMYIGVIDYPEDTGTASNYINTYIDMKSAASRSGLSNIYPYQYRFDLRHNTLTTPKSIVCQNDSAILNLDVCSQGRYIWDWNDGSIDTTWNDVLNVKHLYTNFGTYNATVYIKNPCGFDTLYKTFTMQKRDSFDIGSDTAICQGKSVVYAANLPNLNYLWDNGKITQSVSRNATGKFWCKANDGVCYYSDSAMLTVYPLPKVNLGNDTTLCDGKPYVLDAGNASAYTWNTSDVTRTIAASKSGNYTVTITDQNGCKNFDLININIYKATNSDFVFNMSGNSKTVYFFPSDTSQSSYTWDFGDLITSNVVKPVHAYNNFGTYNTSLTISQGTPCELKTAKTIDVTTAINLVNSKEKYNVWPNPSNGEFTVKSNSFGTVCIEVYDITGKLLTKINTISIESGKVINLSNEPLGIYNLIVRNNIGEIIHEVKLVHID